MGNLTATHQVLLQRVTTADNAWREAKSNAEAEARLAAAKVIEQFALARDVEIRKAITSGVPKRQLVQKHQGLHTTSPTTLYESLKRTEDFAAEEAEREPEDPMAMHIVHNSDEGDFTLTASNGDTFRVLADGDFSPAEAGFPSAEWNEWRRANREEISRYLGVLAS